MANLILVDDDNDIMELFAEILRGRGHQVRTASSGEHALQLLRAAPLPEAVVLDVDLPRLSGPEMAHQMLIHDAGEESIPVILVSARDDLPQIAERMGTPYSFAKAGDVRALVTLIDRALRERLAPSSA
jgi:DNA-binding NtrC family response regulator